jgi:hypothetical protein
MAISYVAGLSRVTIIDWGYLYFVEAQPFCSLSGEKEVHSDPSLPQSSPTPPYAALAGELSERGWSLGDR